MNMVADQIINPIMDKMAKIKGSLAVKPQHVRGYLMVFVNCLIENPAFDSQTKETMTSKKERFGSTCPLPAAFIDQVLESGILQALQEWSKALGQSELAQYLNRSDMGMQKKLFGIPPSYWLARCPRFALYMLAYICGPFWDPTEKQEIINERAFLLKIVLQLTLNCIRRGFNGALPQPPRCMLFEFLNVVSEPRNCPSCPRLFQCVFVSEQKSTT